MAIRVGINGFGRIGRLVFRIMSSRDDFDVVQINDLSDTATLAALLARDTVHGKFDGTVTEDGDNLVVNGKAIPVSAVKNPAELPWKKLDVDFVVESTGVFRTRDKIALHMEAGAPRVLLTVPAKDKIDATIVLGVNDDDLKPEHKIISNASCTTNCLAPVAKVLDDSFGLENGLMTTIHAYTNDQSVADMVNKDLRRARAAAMNIIPTTTGAAKAVGKVLPTLDGKLNGIAMRVPVADGSIVDLVANLSKSPTPDEINAAMKAAAEGPMKGILEYSEEPLVSSDVIGNPHSSIFDAGMTTTVGNCVKLLSWYDNEWGYSTRVVDLIELATKQAG